MEEADENKYYKDIFFAKRIFTPQIHFHHSNPSKTFTLTYSAVFILSRGGGGGGKERRRERRKEMEKRASVCVCVCVCVCLCVCVCVSVCVYSVSLSLSLSLSLSGIVGTVCHHSNHPSSSPPSPPSPPFITPADRGVVINDTSRTHVITATVIHHLTKSSLSMSFSQSSPYLLSHHHKQQLHHLPYSVIITP